MDRPVECGHCKKPALIAYKELVGAGVNCFSMCEECPVLQQKLHGHLVAEGHSKEEKEKKAGMYCHRCQTSLEMVKTGNPLGCPECYEVFSEVLISELHAAHKLPTRFRKNTLKSGSLHLGKAPHQSLEIPSSSRLTTLNEALNEALKKENYEQAAWIRDQIKALHRK